MMSCRFFDIAHGSAMECAAAVDLCQDLELIGNDREVEAKTRLHPIVAILTKIGR